MKKIIYSILSIYNLYCADQSQELRLDKYPIDILGKLAEFMPSDSEFVNNISRFVYLSPEKYYEIVKALILDKKEIFEFDIEKIREYLRDCGSIKEYDKAMMDIFVHRKEIYNSYDYDDIDTIIKKYFDTTAASKISSNILKEHIAIQLERVLDENPIILLASYLKKNKPDALKDIFCKSISTLLFVKDSLSKNGKLSLAVKTDGEIKVMKNNLNKERTFIFWSSFILKQKEKSVSFNTNLASAVIIFIILLNVYLVIKGYYAIVGLFIIIPVISIIFGLKNGGLVLNADCSDVLANLISDNAFLNEDEYEYYKTKFYIEYRKRIPVSMKEIEETVKLCMQYPHKKEKYMQELVLGLSENKRLEVLQILENEIINI